MIWNVWECSALFARGRDDEHKLFMILAILFFCGVLKILLFFMDQKDKETLEGVDVEKINERGCAKFAKGEVVWFDRAHELGDVVGTFNLAVCYKDGVGKPQDLQLAYELFQEAAEQGDPDAVFQCGALCAEQGDHQQALEWFRKGQRSSYKCLFRLARAFEKGLGAPVNPQYAAILRNDAENMKKRLLPKLPKALKGKLTTINGERTTYSDKWTTYPSRHELREDF